jgi:DNA-binding GntR family transcriptional regulator
LDDILKWILDHAWAAMAAGFAYFYKRNETARDKDMATMAKRLDYHQAVINDKLVKRDDFNEFKADLREDMRYIRERLDEIVDSKGRKN